MKKELEEIEKDIQKTFETFMKNEKKTNIKNYRNGYRTRLINTIFGSGKIKMPRDRLSRFFPSNILKYCKETQSLMTSVIVSLKHVQNQSQVYSFI